MIRAGDKARRDGQPQKITVLGFDRYYCEYVPPGTTVRNKRPLLLWLHGAGTNAGSLYDMTSLRLKAETWQLAKSGGINGFYLASVQGRNLHWPTEVPRSGPNYDYYYRDVRSPSTNPDVAFLDALIDRIAATGLILKDEIYITGWSAGGHFTTFYSIIRHERTTPGGNRVRAVATYSSGDPFEDPIPNLTPSCKLRVYPTSNVPILIISHDCDILPCDKQQEQTIAANGKDFWGYPPYPMFDSAGIYVGPGDIISQWIADLRERVQDRTVYWLLVDTAGNEVAHCNSICSAGEGLAVHGTWPSGESFMGSPPTKDLEVMMLNFLRNNHI